MLRWVYDVKKEALCFAYARIKLNGLCFFREMPYSELRSKYTKVSSSDQAKPGWLEDFTISADQVRSIVLALLEIENPSPVIPSLLCGGRVDVVKFFFCICWQYLQKVLVHLTVNNWMVVLSTPTVLAWAKVQNGVQLHDRPKSAAGAYLGRLNFTCVGNG